MWGRGQISVVGALGYGAASVRLQTVANMKTQGAPGRRRKVPATHSQSALQKVMKVVEVTPRRAGVCLAVLPLKHLCVHFKGPCRHSSRSGSDEVRKPCQNHDLSLPATSAMRLDENFGLHGR